MRVVIDISQIAYPGGVGVYTRNLVLNLLKIDKSSTYCLFGLSLRNKNIFEDFYRKLLNNENINRSNLEKKFYSLPVSLGEILFNRLRLPIEVFTEKADVFHSSDWTEPKSKAFKITTVHDLAPLIYSKLHHPKIVKVFKRKLKLVKKESNIIIAVSKNTKKDLIKRLGIKEKRIRVIYEGLNNNFLKAKADLDFVKKLNLKKFIVSDAIKNPRKNLKNLVKAFEKIEDNDLFLVLFGQPLWAKEKQSSIIKQSNKKDKIIVLDYLSAGQLKALYQKSLGAVFPSFYEGFGLSLLEAMSVGCPVVAANTSSLPEVTGEAGILVNPHKAEDIKRGIKRILEDKTKKEELIKSGFKQINKFSWEKTAEQTLKIYRSI
ncbi:hypothetical protein COT75_02865 [Candidatus Beckwithbacteria bacterium CG10_big_fil_rev_8_21_14_0_10_34_10]|uniref:Glycosyltransferase family 1 protein n=1 Tax=Candidatus Beckwithbacteria bacterium CG10_big_fil_rev_8_21_14_0_10_34_10 TaxID=1974495 RepID=A0A2H0W942_9BACT|nr:MAG: hypothetical protein COT75_02865 [Candidatus Beckwithbacteria bacterium CG10_big_fil_rev_8_21_14_0_10_34_10]